MRQASGAFAVSVYESGQRELSGKLGRTFAKHPEKLDGLTWQPGPQTTDADRNCVSNIRPEGVGYADAAFKLTYLMREMRSRRLSGVQLKDDSDRLLVERK